MRWLIFAAIVFFGLVAHGLAQTYFTTGGTGSGITPYQKSVISMMAAGIGT